MVVVVFTKVDILVMTPQSMQDNVESVLFILLKHSWSIFTNHSQEHSLSFLQHLTAFECNTMSDLLHSNAAKYIWRIWRTRPRTFLTVSQTSPGFKVSAVQVLWKHCGKRRNCSWRMLLNIWKIWRTRPKTFLTLSQTNPGF